jgi:hypothetical protein
MIVHAPKADVRPARPGDCGCGCGGKCGCEARCCDLECLVRPNFFCGQVLTDADLDAMVDWARTRFGLARYRHGWGVACGLDVTCSHPRGGDDCCPDPKGPVVYVNPGYAIDCCGNDLVVCEPMPVDLGEVCRPPEDPCDPPSKPQPDPRPKNAQPAGGTVNTWGIDGNRDNCLDTLLGGLFAVNLSLRYHEDMAQGQRAMFRSGCSDVGSCEYTRVLERPCVHAEVASLNGDDDDESEVWHKEFSLRGALAQRDINAALKQGPEAVLKYLRRHPPYKFCFLGDLVCCLVDQYEQRDEKVDKKDPWGIGWGERLMLWLYLDWLLHELECPCWSCKPDRGVPLARVLLRRVSVRNEQTCRVLLIDTSVPHRRPLQKDTCRPIPRGRIDLAPYVWQPWPYVRERLGAIGVNVTEMSEKAEADLLSNLVRAPLLLDADARDLEAWVVKDPFSGDRVAAFRMPDSK